MNSLKIFSLAKKNKKAITPVVATILLIMLTVVAAGIIAKFVIPLVTNNLGDSSECLPYQEYFYFEEEFGYNCYTAIKNDSGATISRMYGISVGANTIKEDAEKEISGFRLVFTKQGESNVLVLNNALDASREDGKIGMLDTSIMKIVIPKGGEVKTYVYNSTNNFERIEIYPILKSGKGCDRADSINVAGIICEVPIQ